MGQNNLTRGAGHNVTANMSSMHMGAGCGALMLACGAASSSKNASTVAVGVHVGLLLSALFLGVSCFQAIRAHASALPALQKMAAIFSPNPPKCICFG